MDLISNMIQYIYYGIIDALSNRKQHIQPNYEVGKIGVNGTAYRSNRNTYRLKRYTFPHIINLYFYCFPPFAILMM